MTAEHDAHLVSADSRGGVPAALDLHDLVMWGWGLFTLLGLAGGVVLNILAFVTLGGAPEVVGNVLLGGLFGLPVGVSQLLATRGRGLGGGWVWACTVGFSILTAVVLGPLETAYARNFLAQGVLHGVVAGLSLGSAQYVHLRGRIRDTWAWIPASVAIALIAEFMGRGVGAVAEEPLNLLALFWSWQVLTGFVLKRHFAAT